MALLQAYIDSAWVNLPSPASENFSVTKTNLEDSYRNASGSFIRDIIRRNLIKVFCGWSLLDGTEMALLQSLYNEDSFLLRYTDNDNTRAETTVYAGPLDGKAKLMDSTDYSITYRTKVQMNFIEV